MAKLNDDEWRATEDLNIPRPGTPNIGTWVPKGEVIPEELREVVGSLEAPKREAPKRRK